MKFFAYSALSLACATAVPSFAATPFVDGAKLGLDARLRYEMVDESNALKSADAFTLRVRPSIQSGTWNGLSGFVEGEATVELNDQFNSTRNGETTYSVVPDPQSTEVNQLYVKYSTSPKFDATLGRQRINLDNQRFVGTVAWRQNEQTYDALTINYKPDAKLGLYYSYIDQVNMIFGSRDRKPTYLVAQDSTQDTEIHLAQVKYNYSPVLNAVAYAYIMDFDDVAAWSNQTYGLRLTGKKDALRYVAEYAKQSDYAKQPISYDADYYNLELGYTLPKTILPKTEIALGYEFLGSDNSKGFQTPLATKHKFNGWTDIFLNTPANGLTDLYILGSTTVFDKAKIGIELHQYQSDKGTQDYGTEYGVSIAYPITAVKGLSSLAKFSSFHAEDKTPVMVVDTNKLWLQLDYKY